MSKRINELISGVLTQQNKTKRDLARAVDLPFTTVTQWATSTDPSSVHLRAIADTFDEWEPSCGALFLGKLFDMKVEVCQTPHYIIPLHVALSKVLETRQIVKRDVCRASRGRLSAASLTFWAQGGNVPTSAKLVGLVEALNVVREGAGTELLSFLFSRKFSKKSVKI